jgi:hypothetical protein
LEAFGRRPQCKPNRRDRPSSETLHNTGSESSFDCFVGLGELRRLESETEGLGSLKMGL